MEFPKTIFNEMQIKLYTKSNRLLYMCIDRVLLYCGMVLGPSGCPGGWWHLLALTAVASPLCLGAWPVCRTVVRANFRLIS